MILPFVYKLIKKSNASFKILFVENIPLLKAINVLRQKLMAIAVASLARAGFPVNKQASVNSKEPPNQQREIFRLLPNTLSTS